MLLNIVQPVIRPLFSLTQVCTGIRPLFSRTQVSYCSNLFLKIKLELKAMNKNSSEPLQSEAYQKNAMH